MSRLLVAEKQAVRGLAPTGEWTAPYHGVTHALIGGRQCTVQDYAVDGHGPLITACVFGRRGSGHVFADVIDGPVHFATVEAAKHWCENVAGRFLELEKGRQS